MKFRCIGALKFSRDVEGEKELEEAFKSDELVSLLRKGAPSGKENEAAEIKKWRISGSNLEVEIESGRHVRAHDAFLRIKRYINERLAGKIKAGIRDAWISEIVAEFEVSKEPLGEIRIAHFVKSIKFDGRRVKVVMANMPLEIVESGAPNRIVALVEEKVEKQHYAGKEEMKKLLWESKRKEMKFEKDPSEELEKRGWIRRTHAKGQFVYGKNFSRMIEALKDIIKEEIYDKMGFSEMVFPKFEPWHVPMRSGHAKSIYPDAYYVMVPKESKPQVWEDVADYFKITGEVDKKGIMERVEPVGILSYAQCPPFWQFVEGRTIASSSLPIKVYDWSGPTYRNEAGGTKGIERIEEFHRIETLFVGTPEKVVEIAGKLDERFTHVLDRVLDLEVRKQRVMPWWMAQSGEVLNEKKEEEEERMKVGTVDFEAYMPFKGTREGSEWLEIQNVSVIGEKYPKAFSVKAQKGELWSGCCGTGMERWLCAFLAQKGFEPKDWPESMRDRVVLDDEVRFL